MHPSTPSSVLRICVPMLMRVMLATVAGFVALAGFSPSAGSAALNEKLVPSTGTHFGIFSGPPRAGRAWGAEMPYLESLVNRRFDLDRWYYFWDEPFPSSREKEAVAAGRIPVVGWAATLRGSSGRDGAPIKWGAIAAGNHDAMIRARADELKAFGHKTMMIFHHEPEDDLNVNGTPAEYRAAFRRIVSVMRARGATNVVFVWNMMAYTFNPYGPVPEDYYPGDDVVDWVAADGYNWSGSAYNPGPWREFRDIFWNFHVWAQRKGKPAMIAETGVLEDPADPQRKSKWFANAAATIKSWSEMKAIIYFQGQGWYFDSSQAATSGYRAMGQDSWFNPRATPATATSADTTTPTVAVTNPLSGVSVQARSKVQIAASAADDRGINRVEFYVNGTWKCTDTVAPYTCNWYVWNNRGSTNWIRAEAYDAANNKSTHAISVGTL